MQYQTASNPEVPSESFQYRRQPQSCDCPIHGASSREPFTAPLGLRFADQVTIAPIDKETAAAIYAAHHSYMGEIPAVNLCHHGVYYQGNLVGALTYRFPLISRKRIRYDESGRLLPEPVDVDEDLPATLRPTARRILHEVESDEFVDSEVISGDCLVEVARICFGVRMPNLASAALARSQERFVRDYSERDVRFLLTWVRADYDGAMVRALKDKGWTCTGFCEPAQASNRKSKPIRERYKWRFLCPVERISEQATLDRWSA